MKLTANTIFIPGATSGIGLGLALRFHRAGNTVIIGGRRQALLEQIARENPGIHTVVIDTADASSITSTAADVQKRFPQTNVVITVAGIMLPENLNTADFLATAESTVHTNLLGPIRLIAAFTEFLAGQDEATIMTVSSGLAFVPLPFTPTYSATKAAIHSFTQSLRVQLAATSIQVIELVPPAVQTALMGQEESANAMPLNDFLTEVMAILEAQPEADEILVENVNFLRFAEARGSHDEVLSLLSGH
ncbi:MULTISPECIES: SDR family oxidoreductase [Subtercola]|uniref:SDR family NAD(P)-dependent oxidoreductase n=1 Tax=Subtercola vilae TaxID=2056433 RepID=A0A4T2BXN4_9MICO|nr:MULTISPECIES: SDR family oxidoreductase [Subtercola]MEA9984672.1 SDR family oxidoreductase [Subtercola sp. RTI3]TIH35321.1 SDR family NAD(P)-dependent oxidoreductase [Subtercola vilae]